MAENVTLNNVATFQNDSSAVATVNANMATITTAFTDVLSRSGTSPNTMNATIDMNNNRILNLPAATNPTDPVRLTDLVAINGGSVTGPSSTTVGNIPTWSNSTGTTLGTGYSIPLPASAGGTGVNNPGNLILSGSLTVGGGNVAINAASSGIASWSTNSLGTTPATGTGNVVLATSPTLNGATFTGQINANSATAAAINISASSSGGNVGLTVTNTSSTGNSTVLLNNDTGLIGGFFATGSGQNFYAGPSTINFASTGAFPLGLSTNNTLRLFIGTTGGVNIGSTPSDPGAGNLRVSNSLAVGPTLVSNTTALISNNTAINSGAQTGTTTVLQVVGADGSTTGIEVDAFANFPFLGFRRANGTAASKTATASGNIIGAFAGIGYQTTTNAYTTGASQILFNATENYTSTANGSNIDFYTTPTGTNTSTLAVRVQPSGGLSIGTTTDPGKGGLIATGPTTINATSLQLTLGGGVAPQILFQPTSGSTKVGEFYQLNDFWYVATSNVGNWIGVNLLNGAFGYVTGAGSAVTQATSRSTGVTINTPTGAITLVSAAGSTTATTFTVTNSSVSATDTVHISQKSGTDKYQIFVTAVAAGSFNITFFTTGGTTTEQPVFNYALMKGSSN